MLHFETTQWTLVMTAADQGSADAQQAKTSGASEHGALMTTHVGGTFHELPAMCNDVMSLSLR